MRRALQEVSPRTNRASLPRIDSPTADEAEQNHGKMTSISRTALEKNSGRDSGRSWASEELVQVKGEIRKAHLGQAIAVADDDVEGQQDLSHTRKRQRVEQNGQVHARRSNGDQQDEEGEEEDEHADPQPTNHADDDMVEGIERSMSSRDPKDG